MEKVDLNIRKIAQLGLMNFFFSCKKASKSELSDLIYSINNGIDNIADVVNMWSNNGRGWIDERTEEHAMDMCDDAERDLPELQAKLDIVEYFLQKK